MESKMPSRFCCVLFLTYLTILQGFFSKGYKCDDRGEREDKTTGLHSEGLLSECKNAIFSCQETPLNAASSKRSHSLSQHQLTH